MSGMQQHMQSVQNPVVKCKACKPKAQYKIINTPGSSCRENTLTNTHAHTPKDSITLCQDGGLTVIEHDGAGRLPLVVVIAVASPPLASSSSPHRRHVVITSSPCRRNVVAMSSPCRRHVVAMSSPCCGHAVAMPSPFNCLAVGVPIHCCRHLVVLPSTHCQCLLPSF